MILNAGTVLGYLELEDRLSPALTLASTKLLATGTQLDKLGSSLKSAGSELLPFSAAIAAVAVGSSVMAANFESSMTRLVSTAGVAQDELEGVKEHILALAPTVGIGPQPLADAMMKVSSTVSDTATALNILDTAAQGTKAGFGATVDVAGALTSVINSYGASNITAAHAGDILATAIKEGGAEAKELAPTLANVVPFAAQLGVSFEEVAANIATMTKLGVPTAEAVTSLTSVFSALSKETDKGSTALKAMHTSYAEIREQIKEKGLAAALTDLMDKFHGNTTALVDVFGRIEAVKNIMGTAGVQAETYADVLDKITKSSDSAQGSLKDMADQMSGKTVQTWAQLSATIQVAAIRFGDALAPALKDILDLLRPMFDLVVKAAQAFGQLPTPLKDVAIAIGLIGAAAGPALFVLGSMTGVVGVVSTGLGILTGALGLSAAATTTAAVAAEEGAQLLLPLAGAVEGVGAAAAGAAGASGLFGTAIGILTGPVGLAALGIGAVAAGVYYYIDSLDAALPPTEDFNAVAVETVKKTDDAVASVDEYAYALQNLEPSAEDATKALKKYNAEIADNKAQKAANEATNHRMIDGQGALTLSTRDLAEINRDLNEELRKQKAVGEAVIAVDKEHEKAIKALMDALSGKKPISDLNDMMEAITKIGGASHMSAAGQKEFSDAVDALTQAGGKATPRMLGIASTFDAVAQKGRDLVASMKSSAVEIEASMKVLSDTEFAKKFGSQLDKMDEDMKVLGVTAKQIPPPILAAFQKLQNLQILDWAKETEHLKQMPVAFGNMGVAILNVEEKTNAAVSKSIDSTVKSQLSASKIIQDTDFSKAEFAIKQAQRVGVSDKTLRAMQVTLARDKTNAVLAEENRQFLETTRTMGRTTSFEIAAYDAAVGEHQAKVDQILEQQNQLEEGMKKSWREIAAEGVGKLSSSLDAGASAWEKFANIADGSMSTVAKAVAKGLSGAAIVTRDVKQLLEAKDIVSQIIAVVNIAIDAVGLLWDAFTTSPGEDIAKRVAKNFGTTITEALGDSIAESAKKLFGGSRAAAEIFRLGDILDAAGGLTSKNFDTFTARLHDVFSMLQTGAFDSSQAVKVLEDNFSKFAEFATKDNTLVSDSFREIVRLADQAGLSVKAINDFQKTQISTAVSGIEALLAPGLKALDAIKDKRKEIADLKIKAKDQKGDDLGKTLDEIKALETQMAAMPQFAIASQQAAEGIAASLLGSFDELTKRGLSASEAIRQMAPAIESLSEQLIGTGFNGGVAFAEIQSMATIATGEITGPLLDAVHGGAMALTGLHNAGILTQGMFSGLTAQIVSTFDNLVKQSGDGASALRLIGPDIQRIWELQQDFGLSVDDATQALIDQGKTAGLVGDQHRTAQDRMAKGIEKIADLMETFVHSLGVDLPAATEVASHKMGEFIGGIPENPFENWNIPDATGHIPDYHGENPNLMEPGSNGPVDWNNPNLQNWLVKNPGDEGRAAEMWKRGGWAEFMAEGGSGTVTKPTAFVAGEAGPEEFAFSGANKKFSDTKMFSPDSGSGANDSTPEVHIHFDEITIRSIDGTDTERFVSSGGFRRAVEDTLRRNPDGWRTNISSLVGKK